MNRYMRMSSSVRLNNHTNELLNKHNYELSPHKTLIVHNEMKIVPNGEWVKYDDVVDLLFKDLMLECDYEKESIKKQKAGIEKLY